MSKKMLIDAGHREETRVALIANGKVEDFDFESLSKKPLRGNIYLARITRVEPSLQAAFVEYGGNRHGFLAFSEIHSDYYQIPVSDRDILRKAEELEAELAAQLDNEADTEEEEVATKPTVGKSKEDREETSDNDDNATDDAETVEVSNLEEEDDASDAEATVDDENDDIETDNEADVIEEVDGSDDENDEEAANDRAALMADATTDDEASLEVETESDEEDKERAPRALSLEERYRQARRDRIKLLRNYRIQEVIKRRQILLIQVVKEERGNKGAALTTYLSLAGRYCVLMPNTSRGGGISRKISNGSDRRRLRKAMNEMDIPAGIGLIIRTAGSKRTKAEIKRDYEYLLRLWGNIRDLTMKSIAPCLIYEEASLIKRAIRDLYDKDISQVLVEGETGYREAKDFMKMLMPSHAKNVQPYKEQVPLFLKHKVEQQLDEMYQPIVKLKSGGYLVIQQTEALISIDVNSGRSTKERNIEATALKTNLEAAYEVARQCRLRDLAGLVVVDFIDMEENRNNRAVERKLKDGMKHDRARIQLGRISTFGLLELSRQRRRSGIVDGTTSMCPTCNGAGAVRSHEMAALRILRSIEEAALQGRAGTITASTSTEVALFILNNKRDWLARIENTYALAIEIQADINKAGDQYEITKRGTAREQDKPQTYVTADLTEIETPPDSETESLSDKDTTPEADEEEKPVRRKRRRRRRKDRSSDTDAESTPEDQSDEVQDEASDKDDADSQSEKPTDSSDEDDDGTKRKRRRGRRGGRRNRKRGTEGTETEASEASSDAPSESTDQDAQSREIEPEAETKAKQPDGSADTASSSTPTDDMAPEPKPEAVQVSEPTPKKSPPPKDTKSSTPKRGGWWQRALGRS